MKDFLVKKKIYNNGFLENEVFILIKNTLKLINKSNFDDIKLYLYEYLKKSDIITIGEYIFISLFLKIEIEKNIDFKNNYLGFFNEVDILNRFKPSFSILIKGNIFENIKEMIKNFGEYNLRQILYFFIFFKSKHFIISNNNKNINIDNTLNINISKNQIIKIDKRDLIFLEISKILSKSKNVDIYLYYKDNLLNEKLNKYFLSLSLGFKKINFHKNIISNNLLISDNINIYNQNIYILEEGFWNKYKIIFENNFKININNNEYDYIIILPNFFK